MASTDAQPIKDLQAEHDGMLGLVDRFTRHDQTRPALAGPLDHRPVLPDLTATHGASLPPPTDRPTSPSTSEPLRFGIGVELLVEDVGMPMHRLHQRQASDVRIDLYPGPGSLRPQQGRSRVGNLDAGHGRSVGIDVGHGETRLGRADTCSGGRFLHLDHLHEPSRRGEISKHDRWWSSSDWTRTSNPAINSRMLCQLSYGGPSGVRMVTTRWRSELYRTGPGRPATPSRSRRGRGACGRMVRGWASGDRPEGSC